MQYVTGERVCRCGWGGGGGTLVMMVVEVVYIYKGGGKRYVGGDVEI